MRIIKFRAWDVIEKRMRKVEEISWNEDGSMDGLCENKEGDERCGRSTFNEECHIETSIGGYDEHVILMQYTGLKDKNGKEIYEGDVVQIEDFVPMVVVWQAPSFVMKGKPSHKTWSEFPLPPESNQIQVVIGNIYENPSLLADQEKESGG